ncbi:amidohydrolase family protein [Cohnella thailandensis]|uniref:Amidohydrolase family protein n=1 Tax=Cohnella thailandensis TaxID=557557 RepID=A0A841T068_9BACL|nr:amidohydrolase family protein [Cohnella thailandensis]MBB6635798.1 amidohydrolase family protein [Cohnella thailandensis]MBP1976176.1 cytosine deaminase [Cohnella thailandensis]
MKNASVEVEAVNARLPLSGDDRLYTLRIANGEWIGIEPQESAVSAEGHVPIAELGLQELAESPLLDLQGRVVLPGFVDAHMHLDKAYTVSKVRNVSGTLPEAIENYRSFAPTFSKENIRERIVRAALSAASYGTLTLRSHLDVAFHLGRDVAMRTVEAALEARERVKSFVDIQYFPMFFYDPANEQALTEFAEETLRMGIDGVGGAPHLTPDPAKNIDWAFRLATKFNRPIDLHADETDDPNMKTIDVICDYVLRHRYRGRATAGHLCSLSAMEQEEADRLIAKMAEAGIGAVTLPPVNLYLQGRGDKGNVRRGVTRVRELATAGVPIAAASDNIQDPFHPFGRGDLLQIGLVTAYAAHLAKEEDIPTLLRMLTSLPAQITGTRPYGIEPNHPAGFVVFDTQSGEELFQELPATRWVYNRSRWIHASRLNRQWAQAGQPLGMEPIG